MENKITYFDRVTLKDAFAPSYMIDVVGTVVDKKKTGHLVVKWDTIPPQVSDNAFKDGQSKHWPYQLHAYVEVGVVKKKQVVHQEVNNWWHLKFE